MTATVTRIWRYPIKSHGREPLASVLLSEGLPLPFDRLWAVAHDATDVDGSEWASCRNFTRVAGSPKLAAITARMIDDRSLTLSHPERADLTFAPDTEAAALLDWLRGFVPGNRPQPARLLRAGGRQFLDSSKGDITLCNMASHRAIETSLGTALDIARWRGNLWIDGAAPWAEFDWIGKRIRIGQAVLEILGRTERCLATHANPATGERDADILATLDRFGHRDFSVKARVTRGGPVHLNDPVEVLR